jgi:photosynthetic reaction center cytochrome c subunit
MRVRKGIELRSNGQPRAAVPTFFVGIATILLICGLAMISGASAQSAAGTPQTSQTANAPGPKTMEQQFKNIQVLKGIPADQLIPAMQFITASLGVECEFCHVEGAFEKDDKKTKQTTRKMMEMMFAINKDNFEGHREVTCYSCHRGKTDPVATPLVMTAESKPTTDAEVKGGDTKEASGPAADQLFDQYLKAIGGESAIDNVTSRVMKGTITFGDRNVPIEIYSKSPDKRVSITHTPDGESVTVFDGHEGWLGVPKHQVREMHGPDIDAAAMDADLQFPAHLKQMFSKVEVRGTEKLEITTLT